MSERRVPRASDPYGGQRYGADTPPVSATAEPPPAPGSEQPTLPETGPRAGDTLHDAGPPPDGVAEPRRPRSPRRGPAALVALVFAAGSGALLYDVVAVRMGGASASWRRSLARELASRPLDDAWVRIGAGAALLVAAWLLVMALAPGHRNALPGGARRVVNRTVLALLGLVGLAVTAAVLLAGWGGTSMPSQAPWHDPGDVLLTAGDRTRWTADSWWWPSAIAGLSVLFLASLWWLLAQRRR